MLIDEDLLPAVEAVADKFPAVRAYVIMSDRKIVPPTKLSPVYSYEALLDAEAGENDWPSRIDEHSMAALCYTTATTGNPKGVPYSHRGIYLHALAISAADVLGIGEPDAVMPVVPMFHVNAWGIPFAATWMGTKQVFPGSRPDPKALLSLIRDEKVTISAGVPTVWMGVLQLLEREKYDVSSLKAIVCGGSAAPKSLIETVEKGLGVPFIHAYGMTETYPVVLVSRTKSYLANLPLENTIMSHPAVAEAAVIGVPSEKWTERPMACVVLKPDSVGKVEGKEILDFLAARVAKWWIPDEIAFVDAIPKTSVGKFAKRFLRERFKERRFA